MNRQHVTTTWHNTATILYLLVCFFWHAGTPVIRASHPFVVLSFSQISHL
jgi:hypothetical protein